MYLLILFFLLILFLVILALGVAKSNSGGSSFQLINQNVDVIAVSNEEYVIANNLSGTIVFTSSDMMPPVNFRVRAPSTPTNNQTILLVNQTGRSVPLTGLQGGKTLLMQNNYSYDFKTVYFGNTIVFYPVGYLPVPSTN